MGLPQLLGDDLRGGVRVQKEIAQDLADGLVGATVIGLGAGFFWEQSQQAALLKVGQELIIALAAEAVFGGEGADVVLEALTFDEHEEALCQMVVNRDGQGDNGAGEFKGGWIELERITHGEKLAGEGRYVK